MEFLDISFFAALAQIMLVNIVLSGDNAVVLAMAARNLPAHHQRKAILCGSGGAIVLRATFPLAPSIWLDRLQNLYR